MGVERAVTRWYIQRQSMLDEVATLEAKLAQSQAERQEPASAPAQADVDLVRQLADAQAKLHALGPCPKPMMG